MRKRSGQVHSRESSATLQLTVSLLYLATKTALTVRISCATVRIRKCNEEESIYHRSFTENIP